MPWRRGDIDAAYLARTYNHNGHHTETRSIGDNDGAVVPPEHVDGVVDGNVGHGMVITFGDRDGWVGVCKRMCVRVCVWNGMVQCGVQAQ